MICDSRLVIDEIKLQYMHALFLSPDHAGKELSQTLIVADLRDGPELT